MGKLAEYLNFREDAHLPWRATQCIAVLRKPVRANPALQACYWLRAFLEMRPRQLLVATRSHCRAQVCPLQARVAFPFDTNRIAHKSL